MNQGSYSIYIDKRHIRTAFLLNKSNKKIKRIFDDIFDRNIRKWGGRFNPIILTDNRKIGENAWDFLCSYDPDFIQTFSSIDNKTIEKIDNFLSPILLKKNDRLGDIVTNTISVFPTLENLKKLSLSIYRENFKLAIFDLDRDTPDYIKKFIKYNFGIIDKRDYILGQINEKYKSIYKIKSLEDLSTFFDEAGEYRNDIIFPIQLCSLDSNIREPEYDHNYEKFEVIIGDGINNLIYHWNRNFFVKPWLRPKLTNIWLPTKIAKSKVVSEKISKFINKYTDLTGNSNNRGVRFTSFDIPLKSLEEITKNNLSSNIYKHHLIYNVKENDFKAPKFKDYSWSIYGLNMMERKTGRGQSEKINLSNPDISRGSGGGQDWMADIYIEFRSKNFSHIEGKEFYWRLPPRNVLAKRIIKNPKHSRINASGSFSVLAQTRSSVLNNQDKSLLVIKLLSDIEIIESFFDKDFLQRGDIRKNKKINLRVNFSNNGKNLRGLINLFGDLYCAYQVFSKKYWREIFDEMSKKEKIFNNTQKETVRNILEKEGNNEKKIDKATEYLFNLINGVLNNEESLPYDYLEKKAKKEMDEYNKVNKVKGKQKLNKEELKKTIESLINLQVLIMGICPHCLSCGMKNWYPVDDVKRVLKCRGCNQEFPLVAQERWLYRLNSLVKECHAFQGLAPVIIVLGELLNQCNYFFVYSASLNVYEGRKKRPITDLDIICVRDGKFIIGEIKKDPKAFKERDFLKIKKIAKNIRPDIVLFSSLGDPPKGTRLKIESLKKELGHLGIDVYWHPISDFVSKPNSSFGINNKIYYLS